ncbi:unnamed protein product, partial [Effrenium voratum]
MAIPSTISFNRDTEVLSFQNIQLSTQGAERQRKDVLKCALRFEKLIAERKQTEACKDMNDADILSDLVSRYNSFKANSVTPDVQHLHLRKYNFWWSINSKRVKRSLRSRLRWQEDAWGRNVDHCCLAIWAISESRLNGSVTQPMIDNMLQGFLNGDYSQDLDSLILSKPSGLRVEQLAMWQDHIGRALARHGPSGEDAGLGCHGDVEEAEVVCANLSHDYKEAVSFNLRKHKVMHMKNQIDIGLTVADALMSKRLTMVCTDKQVGLSGFARRVVQDASAKFDSAAIGRTHHLGIADLSKVGRMAAPEINEADLSELTHPRQPALKLCTMSANGHLNIPREVRDKWLQEQFDEKYKTTTATVSLNMGQTVTCHLVENKAKDFLGKTANENKAVEFRLSGGGQIVLLEEQTARGPTDGSPTTLYDTVVKLEKQGCLDLKVTGHTISRPPSVQRGEESDRLEVAHTDFSVFKPNPVNEKKAKGTNVAGVIG